MLAGASHGPTEPAIETLIMSQDVLPFAPTPSDNRAGRTRQGFMHDAGTGLPDTFGSRTTGALRRRGMRNVGVEEASSR
jgi:hypothetical protein